MPNHPPVYAQVSNMAFSHEISEPRILFTVYAIVDLSMSFSVLLRPIHTQHVVPMSFHCHAVLLKGLECVFPIWVTQCGLTWFTLAMPCPFHALTMPFFSRPQHSTAVERRPVGYLPAFGFFRLPRGVPRRLLSAAYQSTSQRSLPTTVKSGSSTLQKRRSVKLLD